MIHADPGRGVPRDVAIEVLTTEFVVQVVRKIIADELAATRLECIAAMQAAEGVVQRRVDRAVTDDGAELGNRRCEAHFARDIGGDLEVLRLELMIDVERMRVLLVIASDTRETL